MTTDKENFMNILMSRLSEKYKYLKINKGFNTVKFSVDDIFKPRNESKPEDSGFYISTHTGWDRPYVESTLLPYVESKGLISKLPDGKYEPTEK
jgi:primase-polymerase (primpol)-like protein